MVITVRVRTSTDRRCLAGTIGRVTLFASYNGVRSDSVRFVFPASCASHDHLYHGPQVNNQVPPLEPALSAPAPAPPPRSRSRSCRPARRGTPHGPGGNHGPRVLEVRRCAGVARDGEREAKVGRGPHGRVDAHRGHHPRDYTSFSLDRRSERSRSARSVLAKGVWGCSLITDRLTRGSAGDAGVRARCSGRCRGGRTRRRGAPQQTRGRAEQAALAARNARSSPARLGRRVGAHEADRRRRGSSRVGCRSAAERGSQVADLEQRWRWEA